MLFQSRTAVVGISSLVILAAASLNAETLTLQPTADTTLIQIAPESNLGGADFFNAGTAGNGNHNRALFLFEVSGAIPAGSIINSVSLSLDIVRQPVDDWQPALFGLHRINVSWGEGEKIPEEGSPGLGAPASPDEATWTHRFFTGVQWSAPGGQAGVDFAATASSTAFVFGLGDPVEFEATSELASDVQDWVNNPQQNYGWMLMCESEEVRKSARSFASSESGTGGPFLTIDYTVVPEPGPLVLLGGGMVLLGLMAWRRRF
jgi:hypothetical protein